MTDTTWPSFVEQVAELAMLPLTEESTDFRPFRPGELDSLAVSELVVFLLDEYHLDLLERQSAHAQEETTVRQLHQAAVAARP